MEVLAKMRECADPHLISKFENAVRIMERAFSLYRPGQVAFSFNGGKDSTALLHILRVALARIEKDGKCQSIWTFMFVDENEFQELIFFSKQMDARYKLEINFIKGPIKDELGKYLQKRSIEAVTMGTRRGDPNAPGQDFYCPSDVGWPAFMRINPLLDWTFHDIWGFLRHIEAPYCTLYDQGYTSIGRVDNTFKNNALRKQDGSFAPAYLLADSRLERSGRSLLSRRTSEISGLSRTAGIMIIGDELLSGKVEDLNTPYLCKELRALGWKVIKVVVIGDDVAAIAEEVITMSSAYELVITAGGVGPTLDDVTMAGVAQALGTSLVRDPDLQAKLKDYFGDNTTEFHLKMTEVPDGVSEVVNVMLEDGKASPFPLVKCGNIYILPGVPHLLRKKFQALKTDLLTVEKLPPFNNIVLRLNTQDETQIASVLENAAEYSGVDVNIGSYPVSNQQDGTGIIVCLESKDPIQLDLTHKYLVKRLKPGIILSEERQVRAWARSRSSFSSLYKQDKSDLSPESDQSTSERAFCG